MKVTLGDVHYGSLTNKTQNAPVRIMKTFTGERTFDAVDVRVDDIPLDPRREVICFSENPFEWGYEGDEPRQLALAILAHCLDEPPDSAAIEDFMREIVANFGNEWEISEAQVMAAVSALNRAR